MLSSLNPEQKEAVTSTDGPLLVLAGAGSGKTRVVTMRIAYLLSRRLAKAEEILAVTFTNRAAAEMKERITDIIGSKSAKGIWVSTFHSLCLRVLRANAQHLGLRRNFTILAQSDQQRLWRRILHDSDLQKESLDAGTIAMLVSDAKNKGADEMTYKTDRADKYGEALPELFLRFQTALRAQNALDFDDLLSLTVKLFNQHPRILARYQKQFRYVMVDEYQDTNPIQAKIISLLAQSRGNVCVVGDDDQSIYAFRGAAVANILNFEKAFGSKARRIVLHRNYRSTQTILDAAGAVINQNSDRHKKNLKAQSGPGRPLDLFHTVDEEDEVKRCVERMKQIREATPSRWSDFAILYRGNTQSRPFEYYLRTHGIPYHVCGGQNFFERGEIRDLLAYLNVIINDRCETSLLRVLNTPSRGIGDASLEKLIAGSARENKPLFKLLRDPDVLESVSSTARGGIESFWNMVTESRKRLKVEAPSDVLQYIVNETGYMDFLASMHKTPGAFELRGENVTILREAMKSYETEQDDPTMLGFLQDTSLLASDDPVKKEDKQANKGVTLSTIHSAKGLEFPFVFIPGCEEGQLPHEKSLFDSGLEEERRLFYVALTRARRHCCLLTCANRTIRGRSMPRTPSRFLTEIPDKLLQVFSFVPKKTQPSRKRN
jgi:ATP-dependent DNA helicase UvrD/PcrA